MMIQMDQESLDIASWIRKIGLVICALLHKGVERCQKEIVIFPFSFVQVIGKLGNLRQRGKKTFVAALVTRRVDGESRSV